MRKFIAWTIILLLAAGAAATGLVWAQGSSYSDVKASDWFQETVNEASQRSIVSGYPDGSFRPEKQVSYGEFLAMCLFADQLAQPVSEGHWAQIYYNTAIAKDYVCADDFSASMLDDVIPRRHMALLLAGLAKNHGLTDEQAPAGENDQAEGIDPVKTQESAAGTVIPEDLSFTDVADADPYADSILLCAQLGLLKGYPDGSFRPQEGLKRCEAAAAVLQYAMLLDEILGGGRQVVYVTDNGNRIVKLADGQYRFTDGVILDTPVDAPDPQENIHPARLIREDQKDILDRIVASAEIRKENGFYTFTYTQPEVPDTMHLGIDLHIYKDNSQGGSDAVFYYTSDAGWMKDQGLYNGHAGTVSMKVPLSSLEDKAIVLRFLIADLEDPLTLRLGECAEYCYFTDQGSTTLYTRAKRYYDGALKNYSVTDTVTGCPALKE